MEARSAVGRGGGSGLVHACLDRLAGIGRHAAARRHGAVAAELDVLFRGCVFLRGDFPAVLAAELCRPQRVGRDQGNPDPRPTGPLAYSTSMARATPFPPPRHSVATPRFKP